MRQIARCCAARSAQPPRRSCCQPECRSDGERVEKQACEIRSVVEHPCRSTTSEVQGDWRAACTARDKSLIAVLLNGYHNQEKVVVHLVGKQVACKFASAAVKHLANYHAYFKYSEYTVLLVAGKRATNLSLLCCSTGTTTRKKWLSTW